MRRGKKGPIKTASIRSCLSNVLFKCGNEKWQRKGTGYFLWAIEQQGVSNHYPLRAAPRCPATTSFHRDGRVVGLTNGSVPSALLASGITSVKREQAIESARGGVPAGPPDDAASKISALPIGMPFRTAATTLPACAVSTARNIIPNTSTTTNTTTGKSGLRRCGKFAAPYQRPKQTRSSCSIFSADCGRVVQSGGECPRRSRDKSGLPPTGG